MLNLYNTFEKPETLPGYAEKYPFLVIFNKLSKMHYGGYHLTNEEKAILSKHTNTIKRCPKEACMYSIYVTGKKWPDIENRLIELYIDWFERRENVDDNGDDYDDSVEFYRNYMSKFYTGKIMPNIKERLFKNPEALYDYIVDIYKQPWPEAEPIIMKNSHLAGLYRRYVLKDTTSGKNITKEPGKADNANSEQIMKDPVQAYTYAKDVLQGRWEDAEPYIMQSPYYAYFYAKDVMKMRWEEAEPIIMTSPEYARYYVRDILNGDWSKVEPLIKTIPDAACWYAIRILHHRWPEVEDVIRQSNKWREYKAEFGIE